MEAMISMQEPVYRWPTGDSIDYWDAIFQIDPDSYRQDWEIEIADAQRLPEFLDAYENQSRHDDDRFTLMLLIVASYDDLLMEKHEVREIWARIRQHLVNDFELHQRTIWYWCLAGNDDPENVFEITPLMRTVWNQGVQERTR